MLKKQSLLLFLFFSSFFIVFSGGHIYTPDGVNMYHVSRALKEGKTSFDTAGYLGGSIPNQLEAADGRFYSKYGIGMSLAGVPLLRVSEIIAEFVPNHEKGIFSTPATMEGPVTWASSATKKRDDRSHRRLWYPTSRKHFQIAFGAWCFSWISAFSTACISVLAVSILQMLGYRKKTALTVGILLIFFSPFLHYGKEAWSEPLATMFFLLSTYQILKWKENHKASRLVWAGMAFGGIAITKIALSVLALPLSVLMKRRDTGILRWTSANILFGIGTLPAIFTIGWYNWSRFGNPLSTGYGSESSQWTTPWREGLTGLLFGPAQGLIWYTPLLLLTLPLLLRLRKDLAKHALLSLCTLLILYCRWWSWEGGWCWGPRFLLPVIPLLILPLAYFFELQNKKKWFVGTPIFLASTAVSINGMLVNPHDYYQWMKRWAMQNSARYNVEHWFELLRWDLEFSPLLTWWTFPVKETLFLPHVLNYPGVILIVFLSALLVNLFCAIGLYRNAKK